MSHNDFSHTLYMIERSAARKRDLQRKHERQAKRDAVLRALDCASVNVDALEIDEYDCSEIDALRENVTRYAIAH